MFFSSAGILCKEVLNFESRQVQFSDVTGSSLYTPDAFGFMRLSAVHPKGKVFGLPRYALLFLIVEAKTRK